MTDLLWLIFFSPFFLPFSKPKTAGTLENKQRVTNISPVKPATQSLKSKTGVGTMHKHHKSQKSQKSSTKSVSPSVQWTCHQCTLLNDMAVANCGACEAPRSLAEQNVSSATSHTLKMMKKGPTKSSQITANKEKGQRRRKKSSDNVKRRSQASKDASKSGVKKGVSKGLPSNGTENKGKNGNNGGSRAAQSICTHFQKGNCRFGEKCRFLHRAEPTPSHQERPMGSSSQGTRGRSAPRDARPYQQKQTEHRTHPRNSRRRAKLSENITKKS